MSEFKKSVTAWAPVRLMDGVAPVSGVVFGDVTCAVFKADGTQSVVTVGSGDWDEAVTGVLAGSGTYRLRLDAAHLSVSGFLIYVVSIPSPAVKFVGSVSVVDNLEVDTFDRMTRAMGLMHENSVLDQTVFDGQNNLTSSRLRIYDSKANAVAAGATGLLETYTITATHAGKLLQTYKVVLEP